MRTPKMAYNEQKSRAQQRGIPFKFKFEDWVEWWEDNLGYNWFKKRGILPHQYCMARNGDKGPYAAWNVKCITNQQNCKESEKGWGKDRPSMKGEAHWCAKLTEKQAIEIYNAAGFQKHIAAKYNIDRALVSMIKSKRIWKHIHQ